VRMFEQAKQIWRDQNFNPKCPHCRKPLRK
jgi:hypothetical protein